MEYGNSRASAGAAGRHADGGLAQARALADAQARRNAAEFSGAAQTSRPTLDQRAGRWWDIAAKVTATNRIKDAEMAAHAGHRNDADDARRHAHWSKRTADVAGPTFAKVAGIGHELANIFRDRQPLDEVLMDLHNNREGRRASVERRPVDDRKLQIALAPARNVARNKNY